MASVFIVRPFGEKDVVTRTNNGKLKTTTVNFDVIDAELIQKALERNGLRGVTTGAIASAGNIRVDMFHMLITYDLVIADISIDNANVFYELGIRHGLRPHGTILIRFRTPGKDVPFDLKTDRYIEYDRDDPGAAVELLARAIKETQRDIQDAKGLDSPVFQLLPELKAPDPAALIAVPFKFQDEIEKAAAPTQDNGLTTLALLAEEARRTPWGRKGIRLVARAQWTLAAWEAARQSWESVRQDLPDDIEANLKLGTVYQRLGDLVSSSQALKRVLESDKAPRQDRADARCQLARNEKSLWVSDLVGLPIEEVRAKAIGDDRLIDAFEGYFNGFAESLNDYYSGINALGLLTAIIHLADGLPEIWENRFDSSRRAKAALEDYRDQLPGLKGAVRLSFDMAAQCAKNENRDDLWLPPSEAQFALLTSDRPARVRNEYRNAQRKVAGNFHIASEARQVAIFYCLGLLKENCEEALNEMGVEADTVCAAPLVEAAESQPRNRVLVATGHRVDARDRTEPRFPNTPENVEKAKAWFKQVIEAEHALTQGEIFGIAGAASGADLIFHDVCQSLGILTIVVLAVSPDAYRRKSVADGGPEWIERYNALVNRNPPIQIGSTDEMPTWVADIPGYGIFQRGNIWILEHALLRPNSDVTLLALWNGQAGDGPGGTADMIKLAQSRGAKILSQDTNDLFGLKG